VEESQETPRGGRALGRHEAGEVQNGRSAGGEETPQNPCRFCGQSERAKKVGCSRVTAYMASETLAPIAGTIWRLLVAKDSRVEGDQPLAILESMKMEIPVLTSQGGRVIEVRVREGQTVEEGDVIAVVE
jgi:acetyl-CoA carboxylase biotin carboxyl carrier protein